MSESTSEFYMPLQMFFKNIFNQLSLLYNKFFGKTREQNVSMNNDTIPDNE